MKPTVASCNPNCCHHRLLQPGPEKAKYICAAQAAGPRQWMYINVILETSHVLVPLHVREAAPMQVLNRQHRERQKTLQRQAEPGLLLTWKTLRQVSVIPCREGEACWTLEVARGSSFTSCNRQLS